MNCIPCYRLFLGAILLININQFRIKAGQNDNASCVVDSILPCRSFLYELVHESWILLTKFR